jgi:hypothetical protein
MVRCDIFLRCSDEGDRYADGRVSMIAKKRLLGIDLIRSIAIFGAMCSHALAAAHAYDGNFSHAMTASMLVMGLSTPAFICLFGSMLEVVYRAKLETAGPGVVTQKLLSRALQCYLLYVLGLGVRVAIGDFSVGYALRCALLIGVTPYSDILKFYAVALVFAPALIWLSSRRHGLTALVCGAVIIHCLHPLLPLISAPPDASSNYLNFAAGFFYGGGVGPGGPSLLHGLTFVIYGMVIGRLALKLLSDVAEVRAQARRQFALALAVVTAISLMLWPWGHPLAEPIQSLVRVVYRNSNHPIYFAIGATAATALVWSALELYDVGSARFGSAIAFIGSTSLFTFSFGNIVLVLAPRVHLPPLSALAYAFALVMIVFALGYAFYTSLRIGRAQMASGQKGPLRTWAIVQGAIIQHITAAASGPASWYASILWPERRNPQPAEASAKSI